MKKHVSCSFKQKTVLKEKKFLKVDMGMHFIRFNLKKNTNIFKKGHYFYCLNDGLQFGKGKLTKQTHVNIHV